MKQQICEELARQKDLGYRVVNGEEVSGKKRTSLTRFICSFLWCLLWADKSLSRVKEFYFLPLGTQERDFSAC